MKNLILVFSFFLLSIPISASHIVGGDFHVQWVSQNTYNLKMRLYRDDFNGLVNMPNTVTVSIYVTNTNSLYQTVILQRTSISLVNLGDPCYTPPSNIKIEEGIFILNNIALADQPGGYYMKYSNCCRNSIITNLANPTNEGIAIFAMIPDPAIGANSSPDFGIYPADAYFCINNIKVFNFPVTDADGDSLVYTLVDPLDDASIGGTYPYYGSCIWNTPTYSLANICGGSPAMSINPLTGDITASPAVAGYFVYSVRVEEYRNGVKLGEVRRELQYASLPCQAANPPSIVFNDPTGLNASADTISVYVDSLICFDLHSYISAGDTIYAQITSSDFNLIGNYVPPTVVGNNYEYTNWMNQGATLSVSVLDTINGFAMGVGDSNGGIPTRYCWAPPCEDIDTNYHVNIYAYSIGCAGMKEDSLDLVISVIHRPPPTFLNVPDSITLTMYEQMCIDLYASDSLNITDTLYILPYSSNFDFVGTYVAPQVSTGGYYYDDFMSVGNTLTMTNYTYSGAAPGAVGKVGLRFCWTVDCDYVFQKEFDLNYMAFSSACASDTIFSTSYLEVDPPLGYVEQVPNVFTPNGDGENDCFQLRGQDDPCYDVMTISIYNRWGQQVFESTDPNFCWDGTHNGSGDCSAGAYLVVIDGSYGSTYNPTTGERVPSLVKDEYMIQLLR